MVEDFLEVDHQAEEDLVEEDLEVEVEDLDNKIWGLPLLLFLTEHLCINVKINLLSKSLI